MGGLAGGIACPITLCSRSQVVSKGKERRLPSQAQCEAATRLSFPWRYVSALRFSTACLGAASKRFPGELYLFSTTKRLMLYPMAAPTKTSEGKCALVGSRVSERNVAVP